MEENTVHWNFPALKSYPLLRAVECGPSEAHVIVIDTRGREVEAIYSNYNLPGFFDLNGMPMDIVVWKHKDFGVK